MPDRGGGDGLGLRSPPLLLPCRPSACRLCCLKQQQRKKEKAKATKAKTKPKTTPERPP